MKSVLMAMVLAAVCTFVFTACQSGPKVMKDCQAAQANLFICHEM